MSLGCRCEVGRSVWGHVGLVRGDAYGPMSDGVTGSEGGGGRLMKVDAMMECLGLSFREGLWERLSSE